MFLQVIVLDAAMSVSAVRARLARYGLWFDAQLPEVHAWIAENSERVNLPFDEVATRLARDPSGFGAAIRRQWFANVLWYSRPAEEVLYACATAAPDDTLLVALGLHEPDSRLPQAVPAPGEAPPREGIVLDGSAPIAVGVGGLPGLGDPFADFLNFIGPAEASEPTRGPAETRPETPSPADIRAWPRLDAPDYAAARVPFEVFVGLSAERQPHVTGGIVEIPVPAGAATIDATVELIADGLDAPEGWTRRLLINPAEPIAAQATFRLVGRDPAGPEPVHLTMIEVRYLLAGAVCGTASRPLVIGPATQPVLPPGMGYGTPWLAQPASASPLVLSPGDPAADLTIELAKPDRNAATGRYVCRLTSCHDIPLNAGPHDVDLGEDAKTFAKSVVVDQVRQWAGDQLVENMLDAIGGLVAEKLPAAVFDALREVATRTTPAPPAVLFVSAEPYVPWELARIEPPLDAARPPYLGAQTLLGRWLRDGAGASPPAASGVAAAAVRVERPPVQPPAALPVRDMAVMVGMYQGASGLRSLPAAEREARTLVQNYDAVPLAASTQALKQLLDATLEHQFRQIGGAGAVHFAGHGDYDPTHPDASVLFLNDGRPLSSLLFRSAKYGRDRQPLIFLNACMIGIGGELLGDMGGFPGNCLRGGFGGVLGALWEVGDDIGERVALEFWQRALPVDGTEGEPVAAILRDIRAKYSAGAPSVPVHSYLAYVYYGHPRLKLKRQK